ncbi:MAG: VanW family protein [Armatimonadota bacterium]|nr:VanW family protein [Armatimonadota bacterium]
MMQTSDLQQEAAKTTAAVHPAATGAAARAIKKPGKWLPIVGLTLFVMLLAATGGAYGAYVSWRNSGLLASGLTIEGESVGGKTQDEVRRHLQQRFGRLFITIQTPARPYQMSLKELGGAPQIERVVQDAFWFGRSGNILADVQRLLDAHYGGYEVDLPVRWDKARLRRAMWIVAMDYYRKPRNAKLIVSEVGVQVIGHQVGRAINVGETLLRLQNAYHFGRRDFAATVKEMTPRITAASLAGQDVKLGQYTTYFDSGLWGRTRNIRVASAAIHGRVLMPGQLFSFNNTTGERTHSKGYRMAKIFERKPGKEESEIVDGLGGGVCQVSSTLYNAVRKSNKKVGRRLRIVERSHHSLPVTYVPYGLDATVAWPGRDFKFRNNLHHPVYLRTAVVGSHITISIWGRVPYDVDSITVPPIDPSDEVAAESTAESPATPERHARSF